MLEKAMKRIKLPEEFRDLIMNLCLDRFNGQSVTEEYYVNDGLDQEEIWSPIMWQIFYDPLLVQLEKWKRRQDMKLKSKMLQINMS